LAIQRDACEKIVQRHYTSYFPKEELLKFASVYFFVALIELQAKLSVTQAWFDGTLVDIHGRLLA